MTSAPTIPDTTSIPRVLRQARSGDPRERLRLRLGPKAPTTGWVDGGWWPRSHDLAAELPRSPAVRLGRIERVGYHLGKWGLARRRISCGGGLVRLDGYRSQPANTVDVLAVGQRLTLLVVPREASAQTAHAVLMAAGHRANTDDVPTLLRVPPARCERPQQRGRPLGGDPAALGTRRWSDDRRRLTTRVYPDEPSVVFLRGEPGSPASRA